MDVSQWPMGRILQLPDHVFGARYVVSASIYVIADSTLWDISEVAMPDRGVIFEIEVVGTGAFGKSAMLRMALGDQLPTDVGMMDVLDPLIMGLGYQGPEPRSVYICTSQGFHLRRLRMFVPAQGRRLVIETVSAAGMELGVAVNVVVSGCPKEVPDCLVWV